MEDFYDEVQNTLNTQAVVFAIWKNRKNEDLVNEYCDMLCKFIDEKAVCKEIEFYMPQLAHMIIHLELEWSSTSLERFALMLSQTSIHAALELTYLLFASMEDYQPENGSEDENPRCNMKLFFRCVRLIKNIETAVIYCPPSLICTTEDHHNSNDTALSLDDVQLTLAANTSNYNQDDQSRLSNSLSIIEQSLANIVTIEGYLFYKRKNRKSMLHSKGWKKRWFKIQQNILLCYNDNSNNSVLKRSLPLHGCSITTPKNAKYDHYIKIFSSISQCTFQLRAENKEDFERWITVLQKESGRVEEASTNVPSSTSRPDSSSTVLEQPSSLSIISELTGDENRGSKHPNMYSMMGNIDSSILNDMKAGKLSPIQQQRYEFFSNQTRFVADLTDMCERLRFLDKKDRGGVLKQDLRQIRIASGVYVPLCSSTDPWYFVRAVLPNEAHAFSTKARCPALVFFESEKHPDDVDVASYLAMRMHQIEGDRSGHINPALTLSTSITTDNYSLIAATSTADVGRKRVSVLWREDAGMARLVSGSASGKSKSVTALLAAKEKSKHALRTILTSDSADLGPGNSTGEMGVTQEGPLSPTSGAEAGVISKTQNVFGERFAEKSVRLREQSNLEDKQGWTLQGFLAKSNDDLRQEVLVMQLIQYYDKAFKAAGLPLWLFSYRIMSTSKSTGLIELIPDAISLDGLKKSTGYPGSLLSHFEKSYKGAQLDYAKKNFMKSMAAYSVIAYLLAIKDRHNGNVMLDAEGHIIHIDFGFVFGLAPGKQFSMETAPWKLTVEMAEVLGGPQGQLYTEYLSLVTQGFLVARKHASQVETMMEIMSFSSNFPGFRYNPRAIAEFKGRLHLEVPDSGMPDVVRMLANRSYNHTGANRYDRFQLMTNGIAV